MNTVLSFLAVKQIRNNLVVLLILSIGLIPFILKMDSVFVQTLKGDFTLSGTVIMYTFILTIIICRVLYLIDQHKTGKNKL